MNSTPRDDGHNEMFELGERIKELRCIYSIIGLLSEKGNAAMEDVLKEAVALIPPGWQYPENTGAKIVVYDMEYCTQNYIHTDWRLKEELLLDGGPVGFVEVCYLEEKPPSDEGPFLREERNLISAIARKLVSYIRQKQMNEELEAVYDNAPVLMCIVDSKRRVLKGNKVFKKYTGWTETDKGTVAIGGAISCLHASDDQRGCSYGPNCSRCPLLFAISDTINTGTPHEGLEHRAILKKNGMVEEVCMLAYTSIIPGAHMNRYLLSLTDITELKKAERDARNYSRQLELILESAGEGIFGLDTSGVHTFVNPAAERILGYEPGELQGKESHVTWHYKKSNGEPYPVEECRICDTITVGAIHKGEDIFVRKDGVFINVEFSSMPIIDNQRVTGAVVIFRDVTPVRRYMQRLKESEERLALATKGTGIGIWDYRIKENHLIWDERMFEIFGVNKETFSRTFDDWRKCVIPEDIAGVMEKLNHALFSNEEFRTEFRIQKSDGELRHISGGGIVIRDDEGNPERIVGINYDITDRKRAEEELIKAKNELESINLQLKQSMEKSNRLALDAQAATIAKNSFLANMSHEIRTPMNGIIGFLRLLEESGLSRSQKEYMNYIKAATENLLKIINDLLDFSRIEAGKLALDETVFDLRKVVENSVMLYSAKAREKRLKLQLTFRQDIPLIFTGDAGRLMQVISNLISNAIKFTHEGYVSVEVEHRATDWQAGLAEIMFTVKDTGIGISEQLQKQLFAPFTQGDSTVTKKYGGTGLGLSICKSIVEMMDGRIWVKSLEGKGSDFIFTVRLKKAEEQQQNASADEQGTDAARLVSSGGTGVKPEHGTIRENEGQNRAIPHKTPEILLAEDDEINRKLFVRLLQKDGLECDVAVNGEEAIAAFSRKMYDIVFMDCQMPVMDGYEAARRMRGMEKPGHRTLIVALTAYTMEGDARKSFDAGMDKHISKPLDWNEVIKIIKDYVPDTYQKAIMTFMQETGLDRATSSELMSDFCEHGNRLLAEAGEAFRKGDTDTLGKVLHKLKGSSANMRLRHMTQLFKEAEEAVMSQDGAVLKKSLDSLEEMLQRLCPQNKR